ncbi:hypothetical protein EG68_00177 [Paragonimus skrjabini miyazakii]|uniref:Uncharacterized protein n=1 Tax=Paragonimus skrjabini miyazakii TaxID=59628 RepID=A0A8S9Z9W9_9TREM|nr:hypothetical protein EG68_00177 [Paragonimus skrjabini miyazakii]
MSMTWKLTILYAVHTFLCSNALLSSARDHREQFEQSASNLSQIHRLPRNVKPIIYIGVILAQGDEELETTFRIGIQAANEILAQSDTLRDHQLEAIIELAPEENVFAATQLACKLLTKGIVALFGPRSSRLSQALLSLANRFGIPYIETHWNFTPIPGTYAFSMHPRVQTFGLGLYEILTQVEKWRKMTVIHSQPDDLFKFATLLHNFEGIVKMKTWDAGTATSKAMLAELSQKKEKNFLIDIPSWQVRDFLVMDVSMLDMTAFKVDLGAEIKTITIMHRPTEHNPRSRLPGDLSGSLTLSTKTIRQTKVDAVKMLNTQFGIVYDSLLVLAHGLVTVIRTRPLLPQKLSCERPPGLWPLGLSLINAMKAASPESVRALTGPFRFDLEGLRTMFDLTTLELTEGGFMPSGVWNVDERMKVTKKTIKKPTKSEMGNKKEVYVVATKVDAPFMISLTKDAYGRPLPNPEAWTGYCKDLLDGLAEELHFNYTIRPSKEYGSGKDIGNGTIVYDGIMGELIRKEVDMAVAGFTITYEREKVVDFSTPWMTVGGSILFTRPKSQKPSLFSFMQPLAPKVWLYVVAIYLAVCVCMFVAARLSPYEWTAPHPCDENSDVRKNQFTLLNSFYYYISALLNQGVELAPQATSTRLLTGVWWFFGLIIIATYTANLAAFLTVENTKSPIESAEDLANQEKIKYGTLRSGSSRDFFRYTSIPTFKKMGQFMDKYPDATCPDTNSCIERVRKGGYAFILESAWNEYYVQRMCDLMQVGDLLDSKGYGIGFPQGSRLRDGISKAILKLQNNQVLANLKRKWWTEYNISEPCSLLKEQNKAPSPLGVEQVGGVFIMLLVGFMIGFIVAVVEFIIATRDQKRSDVLRRMWRELKFASRCLTTSKRLKSEVHKLPRSRSNIKLVASLPHSMSALDQKSKFPNVQSLPITNDNTAAATVTTGATGHKPESESREPLLVVPAGQPMETAALSLPGNPPAPTLGSLDQSDVSSDLPPDYPVTAGSQLPQYQSTVRRTPTTSRTGKTSLAHPQLNRPYGQELWQFNQSR